VIAMTNANDLLATISAVVDGIQVGNAAAQPARGAGVGLDDVQFEAPAGWKSTRVKDGIRLDDPSGKCSIVLVPPQALGKSLEDDADVAFNALFTGFKRELESSGPYRKIARGVSGDGWEFIKVDSFLSRPAGGPDAFAKTEVFGLVFAARLDSATIVI